MACTVIAKFSCKEGDGKQFLEVSTTMYPETYSREGFIDIATHVDQDNSDVIILVEHLQNRSGHESYIAWRGERGDVEKLMPFLDGHPEFGYYNLVDG